MSSINDKPLIQKVGEIAMVSSNKDDKLVIKTVRFDDKWSIKSTVIPNMKDKNLCDLFIDNLLLPEKYLKGNNDETNEHIDNMCCFVTS